MPEFQIKLDLYLAEKLILEIFDPEKKIESFSLEGKSESQKLDMMLLYLRRVHSYCLYCTDEYEDERMLATCCGPSHLRSNQTIPTEDFPIPLIEEPEEFLS
jgi:hypothetical protein